MDTRIEDRRKFHAMALEEEPNAFTQKQDEERSVLVTKQKVDEKALVESLTAEGTQLRETITEEEADLIARHKNAMSEMESSHVQQQANLDARHSAARQQLQMDLQKRKTNLLADQQASRDQLASDYRMKLSKVIEHAQNELNQALLGKACVLLTGAPAAGKTCLISQLMMNALNDKQSSFVPIAIKVQQLQRALLQDCAELNSLQSSIQSEREQLDSKQRGERDAAQFDQLQAVEKRLKKRPFGTGTWHQLPSIPEEHICKCVELGGCLPARAARRIVGGVFVAASSADSRHDPLDGIDEAQRGTSRTSHSSSTGKARACYGRHLTLRWTQRAAVSGAI